MEQEQITPRVNKELLPKYVNRTVRVVGRVTGKRDNEVELETTDGTITVRLNNSSGSEYSANLICEVIGKVREDSTIEEYNVSHWNEDFNMENYDQLVCSFPFLILILLASTYSTLPQHLWTLIKLSIYSYDCCSGCT